jgi:signal transduction histidine kinase
MTPRLNRTFAPFLLLAGIVIVTANTWIAYCSVEALLENESRVEHTWQVISQVERIMGAAKDAETGNRGYLITGNTSYLEPYSSALSELPRDLDTFQLLTSDNGSQQAHLLEMRSVLEKRLSLLKQGIDLRRSGNSDSLSELILTGTGKEEMDHLRRIADAMEGEEQRLLAIRIRETQTASSHTRFTLALASGLDLLLIVLMFRSFVHERRLRVASEVVAERLDEALTLADANASEVRRLNNTLDERIRLRTAELETANRELEAFSYSVSHDLRAPLRTIDGFSLALEEEYASAVDEVGKDYVRRVRGAVQRMGALIDALLQLSRITRAESTPEPVDLSDLAHSVIAELSEETKGREITFNVTSGLKAEADVKLLRVAFENLFGNAIKFTAKVPHAIIDFGWDAEQNAWYIRDNGAGFDMYYAEKLFNAFNRLHGDKDFKGSGIGLATVARVVRRHHGRIWTRSAVNLGTTFWFTLG